MSKPTKEQKAEFKKKYGNFYEITVEDGRVIFLKDPVYDFNIMKMAASALEKDRSAEAYAKIIVGACFIAGDESVKEDESVIDGIADDIKSLLDLPDTTTDKVGENYHIKVGKFKVETKPSTRMDRAFAEKQNGGEDPYMTNVYLLDRLAVNYEQVKKLKTHMPSYIAVLSAMDKIKTIKFSSIKKH